MTMAGLARLALPTSTEAGSSSSRAPMVTMAAWLQPGVWLLEVLRASQRQPLMGAITIIYVV